MDTGNISSQTGHNDQFNSGNNKVAGHNDQFNSGNNKVAGHNDQFNSGNNKVAGHNDLNSGNNKVAGHNDLNSGNNIKITGHYDQSYTLTTQDSKCPFTFQKYHRRFSLFL